MAEQVAADIKTYRAVHKFARISPRKVRLVIDLIRGCSCSQALDLLRHTKKRASVFVDKVLRSAMANAEEQEADVTRLTVTEARVDGGPSMKRWRPKDRGRAHPILKRTSHIIVCVAEV